MKTNLNIVAVIHARGGSKRVPLKNIKEIGGKPLICYMIDVALKSKYLARTIVSTDHPDIIRISKEAGAEVPFVRPPDLAEDCPSELVTKHALDFIENEEKRQIDIVVTIQPTTPLCSTEDLDRGIELLINNHQFNSVFAAKQVRERPEWMFSIEENGAASLFLGGELKGERGIFQSLKKMIIPNGAFYITRRQCLLEENVIISKKTGALLMPDERSVDIDEPIDLKFVNFLVREKNHE